jgi:hypothetical protein
LHAGARGGSYARIFAAARALLGGALVLGATDSGGVGRAVAVLIIALALAPLAFFAPPFRERAANTLNLAVLCAPAAVAIAALACAADPNSSAGTPLERFARWRAAAAAIARGLTCRGARTRRQLLRLQWCGGSPRCGSGLRRGHRRGAPAGAWLGGPEALPPACLEINTSSARVQLRCARGAIMRTAALVCIGRALA